MSKIGSEEVRRIAALSRIDLTEDEVGTLATEMGQIVEFVESLATVNTDDVKPTAQVTGLRDVWREDKVSSSSISQGELLKNAPMQENGYIKVRRVL